MQDESKSETPRRRTDAILRVMSGVNDECTNYSFRVKWDGRTIPGISRVSGLIRATEVVENRDGRDPKINHKSAGTNHFKAITLERGLSDDTSFEEWAHLVWKHGVVSGSEASIFEYRKDILIELYNDGGQLVRSYNVLRSWPSEYHALSALDACEAVATERICLQYEGWNREKIEAPPEVSAVEAQQEASAAEALVETSAVAALEIEV